jgi:predicted aspartyl protease
VKERKLSKFLVFTTRLFVIVCLMAFTQISANVKFKLIRDYLIVIPVIVNGAGPYEFMLDTGTNTTLISTEFARQLNLRPIDRVVLVTITGSHVVPRAQIESLSVGLKSAQKLEVLISDLREVRSVKPGISGVLGLNFLSQFNYVINYTDRLIEFEEGQELESELSGARLPIEWHEGRAMVSVQFSEKKRMSLRLLIDSGVSEPFLFGSPRVNQLLDWDPGDDQFFRAKTDDGDQIVRQRRLRSLSIHGVIFYDLPVILTESKTGKENRIEDGLLPASLFRKIYFNHRNNYLILNPHRRSRRRSTPPHR